MRARSASLQTGPDFIAETAVISELKVTATQGEGQDHTEVARDAYKLSMLLEELSTQGPLPHAYLCILDNHPTKLYRRDSLLRHFAKCAPHPGVKVLIHPVPMD